MASEDNARLVAFYNAARAEIIQRMAVREQALLAFLATSGVISGIAFKNGLGIASPILLTIPIISLPCIVAFVRHDFVFRRLNAYLDRIQPVLKVSLGSQTIRDMDHSGV